MGMRMDGGPRHTCPPLHGTLNLSPKRLCVWTKPQVAYAWAVSLGGDAGAALLQKFGLLEAAIDFAMESGAFAHAFELTRAGHLKAKIPEVRVRKSERSRSSREFSVLRASGAV